MARIAYVTNAPAQSGMGKPAREIFKAVGELDLFEIDGPQGILKKNGEHIARKSPLPGLLSAKPVQWWRLAKFLPTEGYDLWHLTNQTLSFIPRQPAIVTVYDLIELLDPQERFGALVAKRLYSGIPRAEQVICISDYTKRTVQEVFGIPDDRITVIPLGVREDFRAIPGVRESLAYHEFLQKQRIAPGTQILLYVGSDHPRKNLSTLAEAYAAVHRQLPNTVLLKVGDAGLLEGRERFLQDLDRLGIRDVVRFFPNVGDEELQFFYSIADVLVFPSTFEGFGIPPLEAMACGCPVVSSNATSLPEVVGNAGLLCDPADVDAFTNEIVRILTDQALAAQLKALGPERAAGFSWTKIAEKTSDIYARCLLQR